MEPWVTRREGNAEVEHLSGPWVETRMSREWSDLAQLAVEVEHSACLERVRAQFVRPALFPEREERPTVLMDADIGRGFSRESAPQAIRTTGSAECPEHGMPNAFFL